jgi:two-component system NarL family sensor kinase
VEPNSNPELDAVVKEYAALGLKLESVLRCVLVVFMILTLAIEAPIHNLVSSWVVAIAYTVWAAALTARTWRSGSPPLNWEWLVLLVDLGALSLVILLANASAQITWTSDVLVNGYFLIPLFAATQLRPAVSAMVVVPTTAAFFATSVATKSANQEPWGPIILGTLLLLGIGIGCIGLSYIQRSRVATIGGLVRQRTALLGYLMAVEANERQRLSERIHDGALQYVLAARHDLEDARDYGDPEAFARLDRALTESSTLLRSTVTELHPAVLEQGGLVRGLRDLATTAASTGGFSATVETDGWADDERTSADPLLYSSARELLSNVVKHAKAENVRISLIHHGQAARLLIADDGRGIPEAALERSVGSGHIGLASHQARVEAAGGRLTLRAGTPSGTVAQVDLPV